MIETGILKFYALWQRSAIFSLLYSLWRPIRDKYPESALGSILLKPMVLGRRFHESIFGSLADAVWSVILRLFSLISRAIENSGIRSLIQNSGIAAWTRRLGIDSYAALLGLLTAVMFCTPHSAWSNTIGLGFAAVLALLLTLLMAGGGKRRSEPSAWCLPIVLFALCLVLSLLQSDHLGDSLRVLSFFVTGLLLCWCVHQTAATKKGTDTFFAFLFISLLVTGLYALYQRVTGIEVNPSFMDLSYNVGVPGRVFSTLDNPNNFAEYLILFLLPCTGWVMEKWQRKPGPVLVFLLAIPAVALVMTYSRSGWIALAVGVLVFLFLAQRRVMPLLLPLALLAVPILPQSVLIRLGNLMNTKDSSANMRIYIWRDALTMLFDKGIGLTGLGIGPDNFGAVFPEYNTMNVRHAHMLYLEVAAETGITGFLTFIWTLGHMLKTGVQGLEAGRKSVSLPLAGAIGALCGICVFGVFEYIWFYPRIMVGFFLLLGLILALSEEEWNRGACIA